VRVGVVGGGFAGLAAAIAFRNKGHRVTVYERTAGPSPAGGALSLARNALICLQILGVRSRIETDIWVDVPATVRDHNGRVLIRRSLTDLTGGGAYAVVTRGELLGWLSAELPAEVLRYSSTVIDVTVDGVVRTADAEDRFDLVVGADGPRGIVRHAVWPDAPAVQTSTGAEWAWITGHHLATGFGTIWGRTAQFGILPLAGGATYVYGGSTDARATLADFYTWPAPLPDLIGAAHQVSTPTITHARPPRHLVRWRVAVIGDAAHPMRPTFGQGAALAMEDALTLAYRGTSALHHRLLRIRTLQAASTIGAHFATPRSAVLERARNLALRAIPDPVFACAAGSVSRWQL
jgi:2-polyprenyl-6-methoxyphenol hydroxylase-like FAD-dependent oxidoreductase